MTENRIGIKLRLGSMLLDHFIMCAIMVPPLIVFTLIFKSDNSLETSPIASITFYFMMLVYLNKDLIGGKSVAKRILGLKVIDRQTGEPANEIKCFLRNITIPIWQLEVFISLFSRTRRLGDLIANTRVEVADKENASLIFKEIKKVKITQAILVTLLVGIVYMGILWYLMEQIMHG